MAYMMKHAVDPRQEIWKQVGDLSNFEVFHNKVLLAIYIRPEMTAGGILITNKIRDEDKWQGKVGLVLKTGPSAFVDDEGKWFKGMNVKVNDWLFCRPSDGWNMTLNNRETGDDILCRLIDDTYLLGRLSHPDEIH
jgi:co-chaperonin GroES (HSP10)